MSKTKLTIIYSSTTGTNYQLAKWAEEGALELGAEVRVRKVPHIRPPHDIDTDPSKIALAEATRDVAEIALEDLDWADAIIFSTPARYGVMTAEVKDFLEKTGGLWAEGKLVNKVVSGMASAQNTHGGQEAVLLSLYTAMYHWGAIIAAPGYTNPVLFSSGGNPYGITVTTTADGTIIEDKEIIRNAVKHQAKRTLTIAGAIQQLKKIETVK
ncbi:NAD(P)H-dependent oxidoreductase [Geosporobacter subterraneus]|nr:NAD(P)H-dependent oxidoreductase [Geosporobacter subterraneus]